MNTKTKLLLALLSILLLSTGCGCATIGLIASTICAPGYTFDGDTCVPNVEPVPSPSPVVSASPPSPPVIEPIPTPTPTSEPTPFPPPTPHPSPEPIPTTPPPVACVLPTMLECGGPEGPSGVYGCCTMHVARTGEFSDLVDQVQTEAEKNYPELLDARGRVISEEDYTRVLVQLLRLRGVCATQGGPSDEIGVKNTNRQSEQYDVVFGNGSPRREGYVALCTPARF